MLMMRGWSRANRPCRKPRESRTTVRLRGKVQVLAASSYWVSFACRPRSRRAPRAGKSKWPDRDRAGRELAELWHVLFEFVDFRGQRSGGGVVFPDSGNTRHLAEGHHQGACVGGRGGLAAWMMHTPSSPATGEGPDILKHGTQSPNRRSRHGAQAHRTAPSQLTAPKSVEPTPDSKPTPPSTEPTPKPVEPKPKPADTTPAIHVRPDSLFDAFDDTGNGRRKLRQQMVELSGPGIVAKDFEGRPYVGLSVVTPRKLTPEQLEKLPPRTSLGAKRLSAKHSLLCRSEDRRPRGRASPWHDRDGPRRRAR